MTNENWVNLILKAVQHVESGGFEAKYRGVLQDIE